MLLIDKPKGITSHDVVDFVRGVTRERKVGHTGTLDPLATGLLIVLVGKKETKKQAELMKLDKVYSAKIRIGQRHDTLDIEGQLLEEKDIKDIDIDFIKDNLSSLKGLLEILVPKFSAIKVNGTPLYKLAREGVDFKPPKRKMEVLDVKFLGASPVKIEDKNMFEIDVRFHVKSGVYIRSLVEEFGKRINMPTTLSALRREKIGNFSVERAVKLKDLEKLGFEKFWVELT